MFIRRSEKRGVIMLSALMIAFFILPQAARKNKNPLFLIPHAELPDTNQHKISSTAAKLPAVIELNTADSSTLVSIRGIGPYYTSKILRYRERLGGFHSPKQLREIRFQHLNMDTLLPRFTANRQMIQVKDLDTMAFKAVLRHPYLEYEDVQLIFNAKKKFGKISFSLLETEKILPPHKLKKIKPYFK